MRLISPSAVAPAAWRCSPQSAALRRGRGIGPPFFIRTSNAVRRDQVLQFSDGNFGPFQASDDFFFGN